ncbi:MAG: alpha/beta hydrolase [Chloroflexi bacterium]|nr:alpha/beta hydrolase [Chloroflexota bacterium]MBU1662303.1 alpha/beta hydrolase [Chloroflexota bacterium]
MQINNHNLHIETHGPEDGPAVVLLHHGLGSTRAWRGQIPALAEAGYRVIVYDRWGYGHSDTRPNLDVPTFTDDIADLRVLLEMLDTQRANVPTCQPATLIGHSDGGTIALYFAARFPERVSALVTVAAHIYLEPKMEPGILGIQHTFENDPRFRAGMRRAHGDKFESVFRNWFDGWHTPEALTWDMRPILAQITCPALIVQGEDDEHATPQHAIDIAESIPNAELWLAPGVKHMLPQEIAEEFNRRVIVFL